MSGIQIKDYLMLYKNEGSVYKRNKKKLQKRHLLKRVNFNMVKYNSELNLLNMLSKSLVAAKKRHVSAYGVILDTNVIVHDITYVPEFPSVYDILCLESEIESYKKSDDKSMYWTGTNITSTGNFIVNGGSIDKMLEVIKVSKNLVDLYENMNKLVVYSITQMHFSERQKNYIHDPLIINKNLSEQDIMLYDSKLSKEFYSKFCDLKMSVDKYKVVNIRDELLPRVSLICPFSDKDKFFHTLMTFLKLDYPRHLLEFVIVDDTNSEKELNLPEDKRLKLINITNKEKVDRLPLGYKLNIGVKHSSNQLIMHFFDMNNYNVNLRELVSYFIISKKECIMSVDTGLLSKDGSMSVSMPDLGNCLYTRDFWRKCSFEDVCHNFTINEDITYKWVSSRVNEVSFLPFVCMSFKVLDDKNEKRVYVERRECVLNLSKLVDKKIEESFKLLCKISVFDE